jgi:hypothetical protein
LARCGDRYIASRFDAFHPDDLVTHPLFNPRRELNPVLLLRESLKDIAETITATTMKPTVPPYEDDYEIGKLIRFDMELLSQTRSMNHV